jgi:hypothetical protein
MAVQTAAALRIYTIRGFIGCLFIALFSALNISHATESSCKHLAPERGQVECIPEIEYSEISSRPVQASLIVDPIMFNEPYDAGWQLYVDNDLFTGSSTDRDYTGGFALAFSGHRARDWSISLDSWLDRIDNLTGIQRQQLAENGFSRHTIEFGLVLFTPENITISAPLPEDHPYANFLFMANSQQVTFPGKRFALQSALTVGVLGTRIGPEAQTLLHNATGGNRPRGWANQISNGGELTGKYTVIAQKNLLQSYNKFSYQLSTSVEGNLGLNTDISASLSVRMGKLKSPWWSFVPHQSDYINLGQTITSRIDQRTIPAEFFGWAGVKSKYSFYNGFLQGQFRTSKFRFNRDELEHKVFEAWAGVTKTSRSGLGLSFFIRKRTGEIKGPQARDPLWSGFIVSFTS